MSTTDCDFFMKNLKSQISVPSYIPLVSQANLKLHKNPANKIGQKELKMCGFIWSVIRFEILLNFSETVLLYFVDLYFHL